MPQGGLLNKGVSRIAPSSPSIRSIPLEVLKAGLAMLVLMSVAAGCDPQMSAVEREVRMPRLTVIQITRAPDPNATPTADATPSVDPMLTPSPGATVTAAPEPTSAAVASTPRLTVIQATPGQTAIGITPTPIAQPSPTLSPAPTKAAPESSPTTETLGQTYYVGNTDGDGVYIRRTPNIEDRITAWPDGTKMTELSAPVEDEDRLWRHVADPDGNEGYIPAEYLVESIAKPTLVFPRQASVPSAIPTYDRKQWPHWIDADGDCQDTRQEVLIDESTTPVKFKTAKKCRVASGTWEGPFTGRQFTDPSKLDVDHMVPLKNAHDSGAWDWSKAKKRQFANYLKYDGHLIAVFNSENRKKGSRGPEDWEPPDQSYWCEYATHWIKIKRDWDLTATQPEIVALKVMLNTCESPLDSNIGTPSAELTPTPALPTATTSAPQPAATPVPPTATITAPEPTATAVPATPTPALLYDPNGPDRNCGDFDTWRQAQDFYLAAGGPETDRHRLDSNRDGVACESRPGAP